MTKIIEFLKGKKTYIIGAVAAGMAFATAVGWEVPSYVIEILVALGLWTARMGAVKK